MQNTEEGRLFMETDVLLSIRVLFFSYLLSGYLGYYRQIALLRTIILHYYWQKCCLIANRLGCVLVSANSPTKNFENMSLYISEILYTESTKGH